MLSDTTVPPSELSTPTESTEAEVLRFTRPSPPLPTQPLSEFLKCVAQGEQTLAESMLQKDPSLALGTGNLTDLSHRHFENITGFQYAVWALDWHMWSMILKYLPQAMAVQQSQDFEKGSWLQSQGLHAGTYLEQLVLALKTYLKKHPKWTEAERHQHWHQIGNFQLLLPVHAVNEYCRFDRSFRECPTFMESTLPRTRCLLGGGTWFESGPRRSERLGESAVYRGGYHLWPHAPSKSEIANRIMVPTGWSSMRSHIQMDCKAMEALTAIRLQQRAALVLELQTVTEPSVNEALNTNEQDRPSKRIRAHP